jgi:hypothetical protein
MQRNLGRWALAVLFSSAAFVQAQGPMPYAPYPMPGQQGPVMRPTGMPSPGQAQPTFVTDMAPAPAITPVYLSPDTQPSVPAGEPVTIYQGASSGMPLESEPVAVYEGPRYSAARKLDHTSTWVQARYLHWWFQRSAQPALVTSGGSALLAGEIGPREFSGIQGQLGMWLDPDHHGSVEITGQWLGKSSRQYAFSSNALGNPAIGIPANGGTFAVATPGVATGSVLVDTSTSFHGAELIFTQNVLRVNGWTADYFAGGRYLYLADNLAIQQQRTALAAGPTLFVNDSFNTTNRFYGGTLGARMNWTCCRFDIGIAGKVALGVTSSNATIDGFTTFNGTTRTGGTLARASNIGRHTDTTFTAIPEVEATVSYQATDHIRVLAGYSFLYWDRVLRAPDQIDRSANPAFPNARSEFWAQGFNVGLEFKY